MTKNRIYNIGILLSFLIIFLLFFVFDINWHCPLKYLLHISCPCCGITRSIKELLHLNILSSLKLNILGIPTFILIIYITIGCFRDFIKNDLKFLSNIDKFMKKNYKFLFIIMIVVMIINNVNNV